MKWNTEILRFCPCIPTVLCGNKADLKERKMKAKSVMNHKQRNMQVYYLYNMLFIAELELAIVRTWVTNE